MAWLTRAGLMLVLLMNTSIVLGCGESQRALPGPAGAAQRMNTFIYVYSDN